MVGVDPAEGVSCDNGDGGVAASAIVSAEHATIAHLWRHPDTFGDHVIGTCSIFAEHAAIGVIDEPAAGHAAPCNARADQYAFVHAVIDIGLILLTGAGETDKASMAVIAGGDRYPARARLAKRVPARVIGDAAGAERAVDARQLVRASSAGVDVGLCRCVVISRYPPFNSGAVAICVVEDSSRAKLPVWATACVSRPRAS